MTARGPVSAEQAVSHVRSGTVMVGGFLVIGARRVIVTMTSTTPDDAHKLVPVCTYPLTARQTVDVVVTELGVFRFRTGSLVLTELLAGASLEDVELVTAARYAVELER